MKKIKELTLDGQQSFVGLINHVNMGKNSKSTYLSIIVQDVTGEIDCKLWSANNEQIKTLVPGAYVECTGDLIKYNEGFQFKLAKIELKDIKEANLDELIKRATVDQKTMEEFFEQTILLINHPDIFEIVETLYGKYKHEFYIHPAASKNHHNYLSGLAEHTYRMLKMALDLCELYPLLDRDLMIGGVILHDIGKVSELSGPVIPTYTFEGKLLGHITIGENMIDNVAKEKNLESEKVTLLKHIILAHHGKQEFGSPVLPLLPEAEMIYLLDNIDAKMNMLSKAMDEVEEGEFTKKIFPLDNRSFYKAKK